MKINEIPFFRDNGWIFMPTAYLALIALVILIYFNINSSHHNSSYNVGSVDDVTINEIVTEKKAIYKFSETTSREYLQVSNVVNTKNIETQTNEMSAKANERDPSNEMVLKAIGNSWVEIEDLNGNILMTRLMRPGETYVVPNINGLTFNTGNAGALSLSQGDVIVPKLGAIGEIITARPLNIKAFSKVPLAVE